MLRRILSFGITKNNNKLLSMPLRLHLNDLTNTPRFYCSKTNRKKTSDNVRGGDISSEIGLNW